ncbi:hypothetical protein [Treponema endosymbiont of Eucomonympha sp.]|uniref:hypothetical protein n=1 Tax=Treponema endosymbiont of Eucomonympha sp. TaxID=1580831 RepID=UPI0007807380|nr:hypothetical protein [Treponema endosymbiont of Eucomonympha sp.]
MKPVKSVILFCCGSLVWACEHLNTALPETDYTLYYVGGDKFIFRKDTPAIDIYNCLVYAGYPVNSSPQPATGTFEHTEQATLNGKLLSDTVSKDIQFAKLTYSEYAPQIHEYAVICYFDDDAVPTKYRLCYKWQRETTNVWQNDKIASAENSAPLKDTTGLWQKNAITFSDKLTIQLTQPAG